MNYAIVHIVVTLVMMASLIALIVWAWSHRRRERFDAAAQSPLQADIIIAVSQFEDGIPHPFPSPGGRGVSGSLLPPGEGAGMRESCFQSANKREPRT